ncbi:MAG: hypothetical protein IPO03_02290 [Bacteroidetes bacterium]|nr:hypothetical protein [Bacteroidota bacterium]
MFKHLIYYYLAHWEVYFSMPKFLQLNGKNTIGGTGTETIPKIKRTPDGGFIIGGASTLRYQVTKRALIMDILIIGW